MIADKKPFLIGNSISNYVIDEAITNNVDIVKKTKLEEIKEEKQKRKYNQRKRGK